MSRDRLCSSLRAAREKLCIAQTDLPPEALVHRQALQDALDAIDQIGVFHCPHWSPFNEPSLLPDWHEQ